MGFVWLRLVNSGVLLLAHQHCDPRSLRTLVEGVNRLDLEAVTEVTKAFYYYYYYYYHYYHHHHHHHHHLLYAGYPYTQSRNKPCP